MRPADLNLSKFGQLAGKAKPADLLAATVLEIKYDGHRIYAYRDVDRVRIFARSGNEKSGLLRTIERIVKRLPVGTWLDGEACSFNPDGTNDWGVAQSVLGSDHHRPELEAKITYVVFDIMEYDGHDCRSLAMKDRRELLNSAFDAAGIFDSQAIMRSPQFETSTEAYDELVANGYEGAIVKNPTAAYASGKRGYGWYKMKATETLDVEVRGTKDGKGKFAGQIGALYFGLRTVADDPTTWVELGSCSGMNDKLRAEFTSQRDAGTLDGIVIEIAHMGWQSDTTVRHPQYKRTRTDKSVSDLTLADQARSC